MRISPRPKTHSPSGHVAVRCRKSKPEFVDPATLRTNLQDHVASIKGHAMDATMDILAPGRKILSNKFPPTFYALELVLQIYPRPHPIFHHARFFARPFEPNGPDGKPVLQDTDRLTVLPEIQHELHKKVLEHTFKGDAEFRRLLSYLKEHKNRFQGLLGMHFPVVVQNNPNFECVNQKPKDQMDELVMEIYPYIQYLIIDVFDSFKIHWDDLHIQISVNLPGRFPDAFSAMVRWLDPKGKPPLPYAGYMGMKIARLLENFTLLQEALQQWRIESPMTRDYIHEIDLCWG